MNKQFFLSLLVLLFLFMGTTAAILYGRGYRFGVDGGRPDLSGTGILVATSTPNGASVFVNGHLTTATDNTINLAPGDYDVKITKQGYFSWEKKMKIEKEVVSKAEALLFPVAPQLQSLTSLGANIPTIDPSFSRLAYTVSSQSAKSNGIYVLDMSQRPILTLQSNSTQIIDDSLDTFSNASLIWSPDGNQILAKVNQTTYLLSTNSFNDSPKDVTETLPSIISSWNKQKTDKENSRLNSLKSSLTQMIGQDMEVDSWSPDDKKILYTASTSAVLPFIITPRLLGTDSAPEQRTITQGHIYIYDIDEDKNYQLNVDGTRLTPPLNPTTSVWNPLMWFSDSKHIVYVHDKKIDVMEYDGTNNTTIYAGPFVENYVFPWTNVSKVLLLTDLGNPLITPNLYTVELK